MVDMKPTDPVEGMLMAQFVAANEAALAMYKRAGRVLRIIILESSKELNERHSDLPGNPYDGHTLATVIPAMEDMIGNTIERLLADATEFDACDDPRITIGMGFFRTPAEEPTEVAGYGILFKSRPLVVFGLCVTLFHFANAPLLPLVGQKLAAAYPKEATAMMSTCIIADRKDRVEMK
jgi:hypothetical protein